MRPLDYLVLSGALLIYCAAIVVLGFGARLWADAAAAAHRARAHGIQADAERDSIEHARRAADDAIARGLGTPTGRRLSDEDIRESLLAQRTAAGMGRDNGAPEYTTSGDVTPDELNAHMQGGEFRPSEL